MPSGSIVICNDSLQITIDPDGILTHYEFGIDGLTCIWVLVVFLCRYVNSQVQGMWREHELDEVDRNVHACVADWVAPCVFYADLVFYTV